MGNRKQKEAEERAIEFEKQWVAESKMRKELHNQLEEMVGNLRVYCRVRPLLPAEQDKPQSVEVKGADTVIVRDHDEDVGPRGVQKETKRFNFTQVYGPGSTQEDLFKGTETLMTSVLDGFNVCIFAYGQSGTGKTFTMEGNEEHPGLVPRAMQRIFEDIQTRTGNYQHDCFLSMIEIYNENIRDLLRDAKSDLSKVKFDIMRDQLVGMYVKDLTSEQVHTASHARKLISTGHVNRVTASTGLNDQSSRSHMIVTLTVRQEPEGERYVRGQALSRRSCWLGAPSQVTDYGPATKRDDGDQQVAFGPRHRHRVARGDGEARAVPRLEADIPAARLARRQLQDAHVRQHWAIAAERG